ncbi:hypothetical protein ABMA28_002250 [Loxostege sticticalis]|uniref:Lipase domain-containing protein n=1 Tax=Loxostege sticticalis TaxID=481309 RepID=A0ABD0T0C9_LOXSC
MYVLFFEENILQPFPIVTWNPEELAATPYDASLPSVFIVHDHEGTGTTTINPLLKDEILQFHQANVFIVDWSFHANSGYNNAVAAVPSIAEFLSAFLEALEIPLNNTHLIGFGLGAHICGITGRDLNGEIARITGLDPSGRLWGPGTQRLSATDARFVEVIHTDGGGLSNIGIGTPLGDVDFFINGGSSQPGCLNNRCCHNRAWEIMAASMSTFIRGNRCNNMLQNNLNLCRGVALEVGGINVVKRGSGIYRANTRRSFPFV